MRVILVAYFLLAVIFGVGFIYCSNSIGHSKTNQDPIKKEQTVYKRLSKIKE